MKKYLFCVCGLFAFSSEAYAIDCKLTAKYRQANATVQTVNVQYQAQSAPGFLSFGACLSEKPFWAALGKADKLGGFCRVVSYPNRESTVQVSGPFDVDKAYIEVSSSSECDDF